MPAYTTMAIGMSKKSQPMTVTPRCLLCMVVLRCGLLVNVGANAAPDRAARTLQIPIEPDSRGFADQMILRDEAPDTAVLAVVAIVAHHEVLAGRHFNDA